jgi:hypothetical protein
MSGKGLLPDFGYEVEPWVSARAAGAGRGRSAGETPATDRPEETGASARADERQPTTTENEQRRRRRRGKGASSTRHDTGGSDTAGPTTASAATTTAVGDRAAQRGGATQRAMVASREVQGWCCGARAVAVAGAVGGGDTWQDATRHHRRASRAGRVEKANRWGESDDG